MKTKYIIVNFPESQAIINHPRFNECYLVNSKKVELMLFLKIFMKKFVLKKSLLLEKLLL